MKKTKKKKTQKKIGKGRNPIQPRKIVRRKTSKALTSYERMEILDESQIVNDIDGRIPDAAEKMVYSFPDKQTGKEMVGLSWRGSKEAEREFNKRKLTQISITDKAIISQGDGYVDVLVYAYDAKNKIGKWGASRGYNQSKRRDGSVYEDRFPSAKAMSKAQRNAINALLPAEKVAKMIQAWIKRGQVQQIEAPKEEAPHGAEQPQNDWLIKLKKELFRLGAKSDVQATSILQKRTGLVIKDFDKITSKNAQLALFALLNSK